MSYLVKINRTLYVRIRVPADLRNHFPHPEIKRSLRTRSLSEARKALPSMLASIQDHFHLLRSNRMPKQPTITAEAVDIFRSWFPDKPTHVSVVEQLRMGGIWAERAGQEYIVVGDLAYIQSQLDAGFVPASKVDCWDFVGVRSNPTIVMPSPFLPVVEMPLLIPAPVPPQKPVLMLSEAKELWLSHLEAPANTTHFAAKAKSTIESSRQAMKQLTLWVKKDLPVELLLDMDYMPFTEFMMQKGGLKKVSANTRLRFTKFFFKWLKEFKHTDREPTILYGKLQGKEKIKTANQPFSNAELNQFFNYIIDNKPRKVRDRKTLLDLTYLILMFSYTGFRKSEQLSFTKGSIAVAKDIEFIDFRTMSKGLVSSIRMIPLHSKLIDLGLLQFVSKHKDKVFSINESNYRRKFTEILTALGIKGELREKTFHSCRATFDSKLFGKIDDCMRHNLMGHAHTGIDKSYITQLSDEMPMYKDAIEKLVYDLDFPRMKAHLLNEIEVLYP